MTRSEPALTGLAGPDVRRFRDVLYWFDGASAYVLACDSNAGIGERPHDELRQPPTETGYSAAKVALIEVLAVGATPIVLANALGGPRDEYGQQVLAGIQAAIDEVDSEIVLTGSDETNVPTRQTAVGITVIGRAPADELRLGGASAGDAVVCVGTPKDGLAVPYHEGDPDIANVRDVQAAARSRFVHEVLPVGSRGVAYEAHNLAAGASGRLRFFDTPLDLGISAGSSTSFLAALPADAVAELERIVRPTVTVIGEIVARQ